MPNFTPGVRETAFSEFHKFVDFTLADGLFTADEEKNLFALGTRAGISDAEMDRIIEEELGRRGIARTSTVPGAARVIPRATVTDRAPSAGAPAEEFMRLLQLSNLNGDEQMTDDQRDALCNMGESLGLAGGEAEDVIDEYLEQGSLGPVVAKTAAPGPVVKKPSSGAKGGKAAEVVREATAIDLSPARRARDQEKFPPFKNGCGGEMLLIPSGTFDMGSEAPGSGPNEQPVTRVVLGAFYISRFPVTNQEYEAFDRSHSAKHPPWADDRHPVVYVSSIEGENFCRWLSMQDHRRYRLPTEAEWEYGARGADGRAYPWGEYLGSGDLANFADCRTAFAWREARIDDGYAQSSPVGSFPRGVSPFGAGDMAGNVWEWCLDYLGPYRGQETVNPRGPTSGVKRIYRGGSWKSRATSLRATARNSNLPHYASNDVGFRIVCECA